MSDAHSSEWLLGGGGLLVLGGGIKWLWDRIFGRLDKRQADLDAKEAAIVRKMEERLKALEQRVEEQGVELEAHRISIHILVAKVRRDDPDAPELMQVGEILGAAFPLHLRVPTDMIDTLNRMDRREAGNGDD